MKKRAIGWVLLAILWLDFGLWWALMGHRNTHPWEYFRADTGIIHLATQFIDMILSIPLLLIAFVSRLQVSWGKFPPWAYKASFVVYLLGISALIYIFLIRKKCDD